jgi:hypothetical protein
MPELEDELTALAGLIAWPATPPRLWTGVPRSRAAGLLARPRWVLVAALLILAATLVAYTSWVNLHTTIIRTEHPSTPSPLPSGPLGQRFQLGTQTTLAGAQRQLSWKIAVPSALGAPDEVWIKLGPAAPSGGEVTLVYAARSDIKPSDVTGVSVLVTEARGRTDEQFFQKTLGPGVTIEPVTVAGHSGYFISGRPHQFVIVDQDGNPYPETLRLATNTLILDDGGTVVRVEGDMTKQQAIDVGRSLT